MGKIIINERKYAQDLIESIDSIQPSYRDVCYIIRGLHEAQKSKQDILSFWEDADFSRLKLNNLELKQLVDKIVDNSAKRPLRDIEHISLFKQDVDRAKSLENMRYQMLMFTLIALGRFKQQTSERGHTWIRYPIQEIFALANIKCRAKTQYDMLRKLLELGHIELAHDPNNTSICITGIERENLESESEPIVQIKEMADLGLLYRCMVGKPYIKCAVCGRLIPKKSNRQKYCRSCYNKVHEH